MNALPTDQPSKYINPFTDFGFKRIFGQEDSKLVLLGFLNGIFKGDPVIESIEDVIYLDKEQLGEAFDERTAIYDVFCKISGGRNIIVEMQNLYQKNYHQRTIFYLAKAIANQARKGKDWNYALEDVYSVNLTNFAIYGGKPKPLTKVITVDADDLQPYFSYIRWYYIQFPFFEKESYEACENPEERWMYVIKNLEKMKQIPDTDKDKGFYKLEQLAERGLLTMEQEAVYEASLKDYRDRFSERESALEEGFDKGLAKGLEEGREEGRAEGRKEERSEMVREMYLNKIDLATIANITKMTVDEVKTILGI